MFKHAKTDFGKLVKSKCDKKERKYSVRINTVWFKSNFNC